MKLKWWQSATASAGPSCGAAIATNLATSSPAWHRVQVSFPKTGLFVMERTCSTACWKSILGEAACGRGCGSVVSFWTTFSVSQGFFPAVNGLGVDVLGECGPGP